MSKALADLEEQYLRLQKAQKLADAEVNKATSGASGSFNIDQKKQCQIEELGALQESAEKMLHVVGFALKFKKEQDGRKMTVSDVLEHVTKLEGMTSSLVAGMKCLRALAFCIKDKF